MKSQFIRMENTIMESLINKKLKMFASSSSYAPPSPPWTELPDDLTMNILQRLRIEDMMRAQLVCSTWWRICKNPSLWRVIDLDCQQWGSEEFDDICRFAVDRSQGQLVDLSVTSFAGVYRFLNYASKRYNTILFSMCFVIANIHLLFYILLDEYVNNNFM